MLYNFEDLKDKQTKKYQLKYKDFFEQFSNILADLITEKDLIGLLFVEECCAALVEYAKRRAQQ